MFKIITNRKYQEIEEILQKETNRANDAVRIAAQEKKGRKQAEENIIRLKQEKGKLEKDLIDLNQKFESKNKREKDLKQSIQSLKSAKGGFTTKNNSLKKKIEEKEQDIAGYQAEIISLTSENNTLKQEKEKLQNVVKDLNHQLSIAKANKTPKEYAQRIRKHR
nr:MAG TPA: chromosome segregation ATPase [Caudoviricetes sp.]